MLRTLVVMVAGLALPLTAAAQTESVGDTGRAPQRVRSVTLSGKEQCPKAQGDEVVVCTTLNPEEQFRIPKELRNTAEPAAKNQAWTNRAAEKNDSMIPGGR